MPTKMKKEDAVKWIEENNLQDRYEILDWADKASVKSKFFDKQRNVEFDCEFAIFKRNIKRNPDTSFAITKQEQKEKSEEAHLKKCGATHYSKTQEYRDRVKSTSIEKYGVANVMKSREGIEKFKASMMENHGVDHPLKVPEFLKKVGDTTEARYGVRSYLNLPKVKEKARAAWKESGAQSRIKITMLERYGKEYPYQVPEIMEKIRQSNLKKYGVNYKFCLPNFAEEAKLGLVRNYGPNYKRVLQKKRADKGLIHLHKDMTAPEWAKILGVSHSHLLNYVNEFGWEEAEKIVPSKTIIEKKIELMLNEIHGEAKKFFYNHQLIGSKYKPDFLIEEAKLIIEADGLYWHSDSNFNMKNVEYHKLKKQTYEQLGYRSLFFRSHEILNKEKIVRSIILNALGKSERIFGRKCSIELCEPEKVKAFLDDNHLMGKGAGRGYCLIYNKEIVACMQIKNKSAKQIEISRFCTKNGISVIGGFSKLLKEAILKENAFSVMTFIDRRYGLGEYLKELKFEKKTEHISFGWTNGEEVHHRMKFPGNTGYDHGFAKIWDCGQAKWEYKV